MERVFIGRCEEYDVTEMARVMREGMRALGIEKISGKVTIKPNVVMAHNKVADSCFTRAEFLQALISIVGTDVIIMERSGIGMPTRRAFRRAGYSELNNVQLYPTEENRKINVELAKGRVLKSVEVSPPLLEHDTLIYTPKLKSNVLAQGMTGAVKLNIGLMDSTQRIWHHHRDNDIKLADLLEIGYPDLIVTDGIVAGIGGNQMTENSLPLGVIIMARNPLAHDVVQAEILGLNPEKIDHLRLAHERGYGPLSMGEIEVVGDANMAELKARAAQRPNGFIRVDRLPCNLRILTGEPYCHAGCQGIFLDWLYMIKDRNPKRFENLPHFPVVIGKYEGDVPGNRAIYIGDCTEVKGKAPFFKWRIRGCPPTHRDIILQMLIFGWIKAPLFRIDLIIDSYFWGPLYTIRRAVKKALGML
jgi:uncharacterized protein (DUF362 family)